MSGALVIVPLLAAALEPASAAKLTAQGSTSKEARHVSASELFVIAEDEIRHKRLEAARTILTALLADRNTDIRNEANFRLAKLDVATGHLRDAAVRYRQILDYRPDAQPVRLELAALLARMGDLSAARRQLRLARAGALPPEVAQQVDRFSRALRSVKSFGGSLQLGISADSNVNRATRSDTLGTILGDFTLNPDAKQRSGRGLSSVGEIYGRVDIGLHQLTISGVESANLYRDKRFDDVSVSLRAGPTFEIGSKQLDLRLSVIRRWYGLVPFTDGEAAEALLRGSISPTLYRRVGIAIAHVRNYRDRFESGQTYSAALEMEKALTVQTGVGLSFGIIRQKLGNPGYSNWSGQLTAFAYHDLGRMTLTGSGTVGRLIAGGRLPLYPSKRSDWTRRLAVGGTFRIVTFEGFSPTAQLTLERNSSSIEIYQYSRRAIELGITRAF
jgi:hypothetical protein